MGSHTTSLDHKITGTIRLSHADKCTQHTPELVFEKYAAQKGQMRIAAADCSRVHALHFKAHVRNNQAHPTVKTKRTAANPSNSPNLSPNPARTQQSINMTAPSINNTAQQ